MQLLVPGQERGKRISHYAYNYSDVIGHGNFSRVYRGINTKTQQVVAIKIVSLDALKSQHLEQLVFEEIKILQLMNHPNILKFHEALSSERNCYIVTELCNDGNLEDRLKRKKGFSENELASIIIDVYQGLKYLKEMRVCHRDIKSANIFMSGGRAKIADFGLAKFYKQKFKDLDIGSPLYMSPEGLIRNVYGQKTDIWAFGITIYELIHGLTPFLDCQTERDLKTAVLRPLPQHKFIRNLHPLLRQLINSLLTIEDIYRPSVQDLQNDPYIKQNLFIHCRHQKRSNSHYGLNVVQISKVNAKMNEVNSSQKEINQTPHKIIELGGHKANKIKVNQYAHLKSHTPSAKQILLPSSNIQVPMKMNYQRVNSSKTVQTKDSEQDVYSLKGGFYYAPG